MRAFILLSLLALAFGSEDGERLYKDLLEGHKFHKLELPIQGGSKAEAVKVDFGIVILNMDIDDDDKTMEMNAWLKFEWTDYRLVWDPKEYGNKSDVRLPQDKIWIPDMTLYNTLGKVEQSFITDTVVYSSGLTTWIPPHVFNVGCQEIDEDSLTCFLKFGSWTYNGYKLEPTAGEIDDSDFVANKEWEIEEMLSERHAKHYDCCPEPYYDVKFTFKLKRK